MMILSPRLNIQEYHTLKESINNPTVTVKSKHFLCLPIFVKGIVNFTDMCSEFIELIGVDNFYCKLSTDRLKIITTNSDAYRILVHFLRKQKTDFHMFQ